jgi:glycosyltransferase involved in cell wall biosynthesis
MACGTPVVAFNYSGPKDIVQHQNTGYLASPFDPKDLGDGINWVIENNKDGVLSIHAVNRVKEKFSMEIIAGQYIDLYKKYCNEAILTEY